MEDKHFIFLAGLHRSGTSLLHEILRAHPEISGFYGTSVPEDEGQHLQTVYEPARTFGGPGKFAFDKRSYMDETHLLATEEKAKEIFKQWSRYYDLGHKYLIEKSPPNIIRTRFLKKLFPASKFVVILRHPIAVCYATMKWSRSSVSSILKHTLLAYEIFLKDMAALNSVFVLRYEEFVLDPQKTVDNIFGYLGLESIDLKRDVRSDINDKYFKMWESDEKKLVNRLFRRLPARFESRARACGYSIRDYNNLVPVPWLGAHRRGISKKST